MLLWGGWENWGKLKVLRQIERKLLYICWYIPGMGEWLQTSHAIIRVRNNNSQLILLIYYLLDTLLSTVRNKKILFCIILFPDNTLKKKVYPLAYSNVLCHNTKRARKCLLSISIWHQQSMIGYSLLNKRCIFSSTLFRIDLWISITLALPFFLFVCLVLVSA